MAWTDTSYEVIDTISDQYYFAGPEWDTQIAKRFILKNKRVSKIVESSYYLHVQHDGSPANIAFEPSASFGCPVGCLFCASGTLFPVRALTATEISCLNPTNYAYENQLTPISPEQLDQLLLAATAQFNLQKKYINLVQ